ncbi:MAG: hypothetical protein SOV61_13310 [Lachnospiraceae bacterium]|mgnify:FL=1|nr:hypothetical protein [Lachnospiraceae bacterium]
MSARVSERRIRNNRLRRRRQLRRHLIMCMLTFVLVISLSSVFFALRTKAQNSNEDILYKYYKSVMVEDGDTLWNYAELYGNKQVHEKNEDYIKEVIEMNFLDSDEITAGQYLILPYYSPEFF